jgi:simple sugar transport system permease protein
MSGKEKTIREPLVHLTRRPTMHPLKAWGIRLAAILLGLLLCGIVAFLLVEKLQKSQNQVMDI